MKGEEKTSMAGGTEVNDDWLGGKRTAVQGIVHLSRPGSVVGGSEKVPESKGANKAITMDSSEDGGKRTSYEGATDLMRPSAKDELKPSGRLNKESPTAKNIGGSKKKDDAGSDERGVDGGGVFDYVTGVKVPTGYAAGTYRNMSPVNDPLAAQHLISPAGTYPPNPPESINQEGREKGLPGDAMESVPYSNVTTVKMPAQYMPSNEQMGGYPADQVGYLGHYRSALNEGKTTNWDVKVPGVYTESDVD